MTVAGALSHMAAMIIAIDGPAASGKGTLGKRLAHHYGYRHLDTGVIYRAVAKALLDADIALTMAHLAGIALAPRGRLTGRVIGEALVGGAPVTVTKETLTSDP